MSDPEETAPFTHQPYGKDASENPFVSPSGPAAQPSGPDYVSPPPPPPPYVPYGTPTAPPSYPYPSSGQQPYGYGWAPAYGAPYPGSLNHRGATTALVLGIISVAALPVALFCCVTLPGVFCAPFAWYIGARAKREIERQPGVYGNIGAAQTGMWMGAVMTFVGGLAVLGFVALVVWIGYADPTLV